jgi:hypothetical protein
MASLEQKRKSQSDLYQHFGGKPKKNVAQEQENEDTSFIDDTTISNTQAETLANSLFLTTTKKVKLTYLTKDGNSWYIYISKFLPPADSEAFNQQWSLHPDMFHELKLFGKVVKECRYSQSWGFSYKYSGSTNKARSLDDSPFIGELIRIANNVVEGAPYNGCLQVEQESYIKSLYLSPPHLYSSLLPLFFSFFFLLFPTTYIPAALSLSLSPCPPIT